MFDYMLNFSASSAVGDMYINLVSNPIHNIWEILAAKNGLRFCIRVADISFFWCTLVEIWIAKTFNALLICNWRLLFQNWSMYIINCLGLRQYKQTTHSSLSSLVLYCNAAVIPDKCRGQTLIPIRVFSSWTLWWWSGRTSTSSSSSS